MPIGSNAEYYQQPVNTDHIDGVMVHADIIVMTPDEDLMPIYGTEYRWTSETNQTTRCIKYNDNVLMRLPIPGDFEVSPDTWDVYGMITEWGPDGRFIDQFKKDWGFSFKPDGHDNPWARDMDRIFTNLHVVVNNGPSSVGGGGQPLMPLAPELSENQ
jgi:hypothetical protein